MWTRGGGCKNLSYDSNLWLGTEKRLLSATAASPGARFANGALPHL